jgi:NAD(P)-dependent dehydrogenase (short-subunit alcohol dehydrogenase family)
MARSHAHPNGWPSAPQAGGSGGLADEVRAAVTATVAGLGRLDILVNNAGLGPANPAEDVTEADFDLTVDVNVKGTFFASQAAGRVMIEQGFGRIVNLGSQAGVVALPTESVHCLTKAAISHLTKCLAVEWGRHGITVNTVALSFIHTPRDRARPRRTGVPRRRRGADRRAASHRRADGRGRRRGVPGLPGRLADHRHHPARRRRLDRPVGRRQAISDAPLAGVPIEG